MEQLISQKNSMIADLQQQNSDLLHQVASLQNQLEGPEEQDSDIESIDSMEGQEL